MKNKLPSIDLLTLLLALSISTIGLIFVLSSSYIWAEYKFDDAFYFFKRQLLFAGIGVIGMLAVSRIDYPIYKKYASTFFFGSLILLILVIMLQPDFGSGMVLVGTGFVMLFVCGVPIRYFMYFILTGVAGIVALIISAPYRLERITAYLDPWSDPIGSGFQIIQSLYAIAPGGLFGAGLGNSVQKYFYLPEPQTDFIFAIVSEELGFIGSVGVLILFILFFARCTYLILKTDDLFAKYIVVGIMSMLMIQVMINIGVVIGLLPVTGITLPLMSYGGSSLTVTLLSIGIILNISRYIK